MRRSDVEIAMLALSVLILMYFVSVIIFLNCVCILHIHSGIGFLGFFIQFDFVFDAMSDSKVMCKEIYC